MGASGEGVGIHIVGARPWRDGAKRAPTPSRRLGRCFGGFVESTPPRVFLRSADHERRQKFWDQHACRDFPAFGGLASGPRAGVCFGLQLIAEFNARPDRVARSWSHAYVVADRHQSGISHRERLPGAEQSDLFSAGNQKTSGGPVPYITPYGMPSKGGLYEDLIPL